MHTEPERFDIHRAPGTGALLAFGQGIHFCPGQALVRLEGKVALEAFLTRYRTIEVDHDTLTRTGGLRHFPRRILGTRNLPVHAISA